MDKPQLKNHFLVSLDGDPLSPFFHAIVYIAQHSERSGAMGFVINRKLAYSFEELLDSIAIKPGPEAPLNVPILLGGPVANDMVVVVHTLVEEPWQGSFRLSDKVGLTVSKDLMQAMSEGYCPEKFLIILGHSAWEPGQLEVELQKNYWLTLPADETIIFDIPLADRWHAVFEKMGFRPEQLVMEAGHA